MAMIVSYNLQRQRIDRSDDSTANCRGSQSLTEEADFAAMMQYIESPQGCRQAQVAGTFEGRSPAINTNLLLLCSGGCDVCDLRVKAVRNMSDGTRRVLVALEIATGGRMEHGRLIDTLQVRRLLASACVTLSCLPLVTVWCTR